MIAEQVNHYNAVNVWSSSGLSAWDYVKGGSQCVQVVDTGIDPCHPDLKNNLWTNPGEISFNNIDDDNNGYVDDIHGWNFADDTGDLAISGDGSHGMHCTGTVAADTGNDIGVAGVAGGNVGCGQKGALIMVAVMFGVSTIEGSEEALIYAADEGCRISSNSWGLINPLSSASQYASVMAAQKQAIEYFRFRHKDPGGGIPVFAAGNDGTNDFHYPARDPNAYAVASAGLVTNAACANYYATADYTRISSFSNYGDWIDISAPGHCIYSLLADGGYGFLSGTSMATPMVAGGFALLLSFCPGLNDTDYQDAMRDTAIPLLGVGATRGGSGRMNVMGAITALKDKFPECESSYVIDSDNNKECTAADPPDCQVDYGCTSTARLEWRSDRYPSETSFDFYPDLMDSRMEPSCPCTQIRRGFAGQFPNNYQAPTQSYTITNVCPGTWTLRIRDAYGDGALKLELTGKK